MITVPVLYLVAVAALFFLLGLAIGYSAGREIGFRAIRRGINEVLKVEEGKGK